MLVKDRYNNFILLLDSLRSLPTMVAHPLFTTLYLAFSATLSYKMSLQEKLRSPQRVYKIMEIESKGIDFHGTFICGET